jgi:hypothetical protein
MENAEQSKIITYHKELAENSAQLVKYFTKATRRWEQEEEESLGKRECPHETSKIVPTQAMGKDPLATALMTLSGKIMTEKRSGR